MACWGQVAETDSRGKPVGMQDSVTMLPSDKVISMRIFLDTVSHKLPTVAGR